MSNFNADTPQLKVVKNMLDALASVNSGEFHAHFSKNYQYEVFNGITDVVKLDNARRTERVKALFSGMTKSEVSIQQWRAIFNPTD